MYTRLGIATAALVVAVPLFAGGFWLQMGTAEASAEAKAKNAVLIVKATGCSDPATAKVSGFAIRMVDGRRQSTPLKLIPMKEPGTFAVLREWPAGAAVTLEFIGHNLAASTSMLVHARGDAIEKASAKFYPHQPAPEEEMAFLEP
jgi:hypothetical protein